ncbi:geranylgeranyl pyrophosphate synthetase [Entomortierella beljakovae]|nr:geranylgeranyl pyrophosphate synthetase [Entomortierella beljakovae]
MSVPTTYPTSHEEDALLEPYNYIASNPGKEMRTELIAAFNTWIRVPTHELGIITKVVKMLHTSSLLVDDIEDDSVLRRGEPVAHKIFGVPATINCANYVYFLALAELLKIPNPKLLSVFTETGGLLRLAVKLMQAAANCEVDYVPMVELIDILKQKTTSPEVKNYAINLMKATGTFDYCLERMHQYEVRSREELHRLGGNPRLEKIINLLSIPVTANDPNKNVVPSFVSDATK